MNHTPPTPGSSPPPPPPPPVSPQASDAGTGGGAGTAPLEQDVPEAPLPRPTFDGRERELARNVLTSWRITSALSMTPPVMILAVVGFVFLGHWGWLTLTGLAGIVVLVLWVYLPTRHRRWRWQLADLAVELRYGVVIRQQETVPYFRIQQIDIVQGPLDRLLDLATLQVTTASASGSAALPGIEATHAPQVRAELLVRAAAAVADHPGDLRDAV